MKKRGASGVFRFLSGASLLLLLALSGMIGAAREESKSLGVPVFAVQLAEQTDGAVGLSLHEQRMTSERMLSEVLADPRAQPAEISLALVQKTALASRIEQEASAEAALAHMGFEGAAVICGEHAVSVFVPPEMMDEAHKRAQIVDCVCTQTGVSPEKVKIILAKK